MLVPAEYAAAHQELVNATTKEKEAEAVFKRHEYLLNKKIIWIPAFTYELLNNPKQIDTIEVTYQNLKFLPQTKNLIQKVLALNHGADLSDFGIVNFTDLAQEQEKINNFFIGMQIFLGIIDSLALLIAGIGIANVMYASVTRATK
jgi:putative ABC transport system permease protein